MFNFDKNLSRSPPPPPPSAHSSDKSLYVTSIHFVWGTAACVPPREPGASPPWALGAEASTQFLRQGWPQDCIGLPAALPSSSLLLPAPLPPPLLSPPPFPPPYYMWSHRTLHGLIQNPTTVKVPPWHRKSLGCPTGVKGHSLGNTSPRCFLAAQGPAIWRTRATPLGCASCLPRPCLLGTWKNFASPKRMHSPKWAKCAPKKLSALREEVRSIFVHSSQQESESKATIKKFFKVFQSRAH